MESSVDKGKVYFIKISQSSLIWDHKRKLDPLRITKASVTS